MKIQCNLRTIGNLGQRHYALAFPKGSDLTEKVSKQILRYVESGTIYRLKHKWNLPKTCVQYSIEESTIVRALPYRKLIFLTASSLLAGAVLGEPFQG